MAWDGRRRLVRKGKSYYIARVIYDSREKRQVSVLLSAISDSYFNKLLGTIDFGKVALFDANGNSSQAIPGCSASYGDQGQCPNGQNHIEIELEAGLRGLGERVVGANLPDFYTGLAGVLLLFLVFSGMSILIAKRRTVRFSNCSGSYASSEWETWMSDWRSRARMISPNGADAEYDARSIAAADP